MDPTPERPAAPRVVADDFVLDAQREAEMLRLLQAACHDAWRSDRAAGWIGVGVGAVVLVAVGSMLVSHGSWLGFALLAGVVLAFTLLVFRFIEGRRDGTQHAAYRLIRDRPFEVVSVHLISSQELDLLYFKMANGTLQLHVAPDDAPALLRAVQRVLVQRRRSR